MNMRVTLPEQNAEAVDLMDDALSILRLCVTALISEDKGWLDDEGLTCVGSSIETAMDHLKPVRKMLNQANATEVARTLARRS